jgi:hypothetical protein
MDEWFRAEVSQLGLFQRLSILHHISENPEFIFIITMTYTSINTEGNTEFFIRIIFSANLFFNYFAGI